MDKHCYSNDPRKRQRSQSDTLCHAADRFDKLKNRLKESENEMEEYERSHVLKNVECALKGRLTTIYACHEMLGVLQNDPTEWPTQSDIMEVTDATELERHRVEKSKYLEMLQRVSNMGKVFEDADTVFAEMKTMPYFRKLQEGNKGGTMDSGKDCCSEEFAKLFQTKEEVENINKEKTHQIELKKQELELLKLNEKCKDAFAVDQIKVLENLESVKAVLDYRPRAAIEQNNKQRVLVKFYENSGIPV